MIILKERRKIEIEKIKGSRFIAYAERIKSVEDASMVLEKIRSLHPGAAHLCYGWRITVDKERAGDDGEPKGSAGPPILKRLTSKQCLETMVVVVRYFGGTKLGVGGLVRAYGGAAQAVLDIAMFEPHQEWCTISFSYPYSHTGCVERLLSRFTHRIKTQSYSETVFLQVDVHKGQETNFSALLLEQSAGRIVPTSSGRKQ